MIANGTNISLTPGDCVRICNKPTLKRGEAVGWKRFRAVTFSRSD